MDAKELRIGDYVLDGIVTNLMDGYIYLNKIRFPEDKVKPIPLTEEWLLKFGLKLDEDLGDIKYYENKTKFGVCLDHEEISFYKRGFKNGITHLLYDEQYFQHVHQLQNLYFALTGKELTIKNQKK